MTRLSIAPLKSSILKIQKIELVAQKNSNRAIRWVSGSVVYIKLGLQAPEIMGKLSAGRRSEYFAQEKSLKIAAVIFRGEMCWKYVMGKN